MTAFPSRSPPTALHDRGGGGRDTLRRGWSPRSTGRHSLRAGWRAGQVEPFRLISMTSEAPTWIVPAVGDGNASIRPRSDDGRGFSARWRLRSGKGVTDQFVPVPVSISRADIVGGIGERSTQRSPVGEELRRTVRRVLATTPGLATPGFGGGQQPATGGAVPQLADRPGHLAWPRMPDRRRAVVAEAHDTLLNCPQALTTRPSPSNPRRSSSRRSAQGSPRPPGPGPPSSPTATQAVGDAQATSRGGPRSGEHRARAADAGRPVSS